MDDDTIVRKDSLCNLLNSIDIVGENFGFLSCLSMFDDSESCKMNIPGIDSDWYGSAYIIKNGLLKINQAIFVVFF